MAGSLAAGEGTPNEIAPSILLVALTLVFLGVVATLLPFSQFSVAARVQALVDAHTEDRVPGFLGEPRVNVPALNLALAHETMTAR